MDLRFDGQSVIVTGSGRGIGRSYALLLASRGARVVVSDSGGQMDGTGSSRVPADEVVMEIEADGGEAVACYASVADEAGAASIVATALEKFGRVDAVVNNAGITAPDLFGSLPMEQFHRIMDVHYFGTLYVTKAAWPHLVEAGYGRIVNTVSEGMLGIIPGLTSYGAAKGAVYGLTRSLAAEGAGLGIKVNAVAPRAKTRMSGARPSAESTAAGEQDLDVSQRRSSPGFIAPVAAFLAHRSCQLNGEILLAVQGRVSRLAMVATQGLSMDDLTPEDVARHVDAITDMTGAAAVEINSARS